MSTPPTARIATSVAAPITSIDDYIAGCTAQVQPIMTEIRRRIRATAPHVVERISYHMPMFMVDGQQLIGVAAWKHHIGMYPMPDVDESLAAQLAPFAAARATLRFPLKQPMPYDLIDRLLAARVIQIRADGAGVSEAEHH